MIHLSENERIIATRDWVEESLPIATSETLGGVKVGNGLSIDVNGVLSLNVANASGVSF